MDKNFVEWDDSYSVGFPAIDDQHKVLIAMINDLYQLGQNDNVDAKVAFAKTLKKAGDYAMTHFHDEEKILEKAAYPGLPEQKKEHASFMKEVWNEFNLFNEGKKSPVGLADFLKKWLLNHIAVMDKKYTSHLSK
jgi:hemerythrin-like metal-binding protein